MNNFGRVKNTNYFLMVLWPVNLQKTADVDQTYFEIITLYMWYQMAPTQSQCGVNWSRFLVVRRNVLISNLRVPSTFFMYIYIYISQCFDSFALNKALNYSNCNNATQYSIKKMKNEYDFLILNWIDTLFFFFKTYTYFASNSSTTRSKLILYTYFLN